MCKKTTLKVWTLFLYCCAGSLSGSCFAANGHPAVAESITIDTLRFSADSLALAAGAVAAVKEPESASLPEHDEFKPTAPVCADDYSPRVISWSYTDKGILLEHLPEGAVLTVLSLHGKRVLEMQNLSSELDLPFHGKGIFILQIHYGDKRIAYRLRF